LDRELVSRRSVLGGLGLAALAAACSGSSSPPPITPGTTPGLGPPGLSPPSEDVVLLSAAIDLENELVYAYTTAAKSGKLSDPVLFLVNRFRDHHQSHADAFASSLRAAGARLPDRKAAYTLRGDPDLASDQGVAVFAAGAEDGAAKSYLAAAGKLSTGELAQSAANVMGVEARHAVAWRTVIGGSPIPAAFLDQQ
jgi:hypothetical protein